jgi:DNA-binding CsgD family transcriptional regulator
MRNRKSFSTMMPDMDTGSDCRPHFAMQRDLIQSRSKLLNRTDRILIELTCKGLYTNAQLADLLGISESSLRYHLSRLTKNLSQEFLAVFRQPKSFGVDECKIMLMAHLKGQSIRTIAQTTGLSLYRVRKIVSKLKKQG